MPRPPHAWYLLSVALAVPGTVGAQAAPDACPGPTVVTRIAPVVDEPGRIFRAAFAGGTDTLYYFRKVTEGQEDYRIYRTVRLAGGWSAPERVDLGGEYSDLYPTFSRDGRRMVFSSYRPMDGDTSSHPNAHLWYTDRTATGWAAPAPLGAANRLGYYHAGPLLQGDGSVRFNRVAPDWRSSAILVVPPRGHGYGDAAPVGDPPAWSAVPADYHFWGALPTPDGRTAVITVSRRDSASGRLRPPELWFSRRDGARWSPPRPLGGGLNRGGDENFLFLAPDGCTLTFTRDYTGFYQIALPAAIAAAP